MERKEQRAKELLIQTKFGRFLCIFDTNKPDKGFTITSPAAHGFVVYGRNLNEAKKTAKEGLELHYECELLEHVNQSRQSRQKVLV